MSSPTAYYCILGHTCRTEQLFLLFASDLDISKIFLDLESIIQCTISFPYQILVNYKSDQQLTQIFVYSLLQLQILELSN